MRWMLAAIFAASCNIETPDEQLKRELDDAYKETIKDAKDALDRTNPADPIKVRRESVAVLMSLRMDPQWYGLTEWRVKTAAMCEVFLAGARRCDDE